MIFVFVLVLFQQSVTFEVRDRVTNLPITNVTVTVDDVSGVTNQLGRITLPVSNPDADIKLQHVAFRDKTLSLRRFSLNNRILLYMDSEIFSDSVDVVSTIERIVPPGKSEVFTKRIEIDAGHFRVVAAPSDLVSNYNAVSVERTIDGKSLIRVLGNEDYELNSAYNEFSLNFKNKLVTLMDVVPTDFIRNMTLELGQDDQGFARIQLEPDTSARTIVTAGLSEQQKKFSASTGFKFERYSARVGFDYVNRNKALIIQDFNGVENAFNSLFQMGKAALNQTAVFGGIGLQSSTLLRVHTDAYTDQIDKTESTVINGLRVLLPYDLIISNETVFDQLEYDNISNPAFINRRDETGWQNTFSLSKSMKWEANQLNVKLKHHSHFQKVVFVDASNRRVEGWDDLFSIELRNKFTPTGRADEKRTAFEVYGDYTVSERAKFIRSAGLKASILFGVNSEYELYSEYAYNHQPILQAQRAYFISDQLIPEFSNTTNIMLGLRTMIYKIQFDVNYSLRDYENYLQTVYGVLFNRFRTVSFNGLESASAEIRFDNQWITTGVSLTNIFGDDLESFSFRTPFSLQANLAGRYRGHSLLIKGSYESGKTISVEQNNVIFQRELDSESVVNVSYSYTFTELDLPGLTASINVQNLLGEDLFLSNGFINSRRDIYASVSYTF